jgi:signal transduction histidine kinase
MDAATLARAFDPFFSTRFPGRGLGLPAAEGIVRGHGGGVHVDSTPGVGTTVTLALPVAPETAAVLESPYGDRARSATGERALGGRHLRDS